MQAPVGEALLDLVHVDGIHDDHDVRLVLLEKIRADVLDSDSWNEVSQHVGIDVYDMLDYAQITEMRQESDRLRATTPDDNSFPLVLETR